MHGLSKSSAKLISLMFVLILAGCTATVPLMSEQFDTAAERFEPETGMGNVYVVRENRFAGSAVAFQVQLDGRGSGSIAPGTYHLFEVDPGRHVVSVSTMENAEHVELDVVEGKNYFVEIKPKMGWIVARVSVAQVDETRGRQLVIDGQRAESLTYD